MPQISPHLKFHRDAREALEFYRSVFGGDLEIRTFADYGAPTPDGDQDLVMYGVLRTPWGFELLASDSPGQIPPPVHQGSSLWVTGPEVIDLRGYWTKLSHGAEVERTLDVAPFGDAYGQLIDKFGVLWEVSIEGSGEVHRRH